jgi:hypothetical protein
VGTRPRAGHAAVASLGASAGPWSRDPANASFFSDSGASGAGGGGGAGAHPAAAGGLASWIATSDQAAIFEHGRCSGTKEIPSNRLLHASGITARPPADLSADPPERRARSQSAHLYSQPAGRTTGQQTRQLFAKQATALETSRVRVAGKSASQTALALERAQRLAGSLRRRKQHSAEGQDHMAWMSKYEDAARTRSFA